MPCYESASSTVLLNVIIKEDDAIQLLHVSDLHFGPPYIQEVGEAALRIASTLSLDAHATFFERLDSHPPATSQRKRTVPVRAGAVGVATPSQMLAVHADETQKH